MAAANSASDRDSRVEHLRKALACRPDHPANIAIEYRIGIELSQRIDRDHGTGLRLPEALVVFEHIMTRYRHLDYYSSEPADRPDSPQVLVPQAAILAACIQRGVNHNSQKAREYLVCAMRHLEKSFERRVTDWAGVDVLPEVGASDGDPIETSKARSRAEYLSQRKRAAASGDVFGSQEMATVRAAVRQFAYTYGKQKPHEVPVVMGEIVKMLPGTPMAKVAQEHTRRAVKMSTEDAAKVSMREQFETLPPLPPTLSDRGVAAVAIAPPPPPRPAPVRSSSPAEPRGESIALAQRAEETDQAMVWAWVSICTGLVGLVVVYLIYRFKYQTPRTGRAFVGGRRAPGGSARRPEPPEATRT
jgi:hypothetical protein